MECYLNECSLSFKNIVYESHCNPLVSFGFLQEQLRDEKSKEDLLAGNRVCYRSGGWSLYPRVWSNNRCTFEPVTSADEVSEWDIVFCQVLPRSRFFAHYVKYKYWAADQWVFTISNAKGWENGRTDIEHIYGILVNVEW